jgi:cell fate regulator YaaT (PSP1 superfamily)
MGCTDCSSTGLPRGCKNNGACGVGGCDKLSVFDWLANMDQPSDKDFDIVELRFKNGRKEFFRNTQRLSLQINEALAVEGSPGHDIGTVSMIGQLVKLQLRQKNLDPEKENFRKIYRKATQRDIDIWQKAREKEWDTMILSRKIIDQLGLEMKLSDVEYQGDGNKATFYYTADGRVDFRELIRKLAGEFRVRIEMKQIGTRQEAARVGGIGSCGRELCCSTWLTDFRSVNTSAARYQQLALNPQKLAGQCGKLKCCLNYELDSYLEALKAFPKTDTVLKTQKGEAVYMKMDIFKGLMWYGYREHAGEWIPLPVEKVNEIIGMNQGGKMPDALEEYGLTPATLNKEFEVGAQQDSLNRFDDKLRSRKRNKKRRKPRSKNAKNFKKN